MQFLKNNWPYIILVFIVALSAIFRLWDLSSIPPGIYPDEAKNANDAIVTLAQNDYQIFYPENNGREGLYIWFIALSFKYLGVSIFALKLVSAISGILTVVATYFLTRELLRFSTKELELYRHVPLSHFAREVAALLAAGMLATSFWHINFSRIGFRAILVPLILSVALYFTLRALRTKNMSDVILSGIMWGLGYYTYIAFRIALVIPLFLITASYLGYLYHNRPHFTREWFRDMYIRDGWWKFNFWFIPLGLTLLPFVRHFMQNPGDAVSRSSGISVFSAENPLLALAQSVGLHLQMFFFRGDGNWRHNFSGDAQLLWPVALLFVAGIIYSLWRSWEGARYRIWSTPIMHLTLGLWFVAMLAPAALTTEGIPHALRAIGLMPVVFIIAAFGFLFVIRLLFPHRHHRSDIWPFGLGTAVILILLLASFQFSHYFVDWGRNDETRGAFSAGYVAMGEHFNALPQDTHKYLIVNTGGVDVSYPKEILLRTNTDNMLPMSAQTTLFIQQTKERPIQNTTYLQPEELPFLKASKNIFIPLEANDEIKQLLRDRYRFGREEQLDGFWAYSVGY